MRRSLAASPPSNARGAVKHYIGILQLLDVFLAPELSLAQEQTARAMGANE